MLARSNYQAMLVFGADGFMESYHVFMPSLIKNSPGGTPPNLVGSTDLTHPLGNEPLETRITGRSHPIRVKVNKASRARSPYIHEWHHKNSSLTSALALSPGPVHEVKYLWNSLIHSIAGLAVRIFFGVNILYIIPMCLLIIIAARIWDVPE